MDKNTTSHQVQSIAFLLVEGFALMSFSAAVEPLRAANLLAGRKVYNVEYACTNNRFASSSSGARVDATIPLEELTRMDIVLLVAGGDPFLVEDAVLFKTLRHLAQKKVILGGVSGGPVILAKCDVMHGRRMTLHWQHAKTLQALYPNIEILRSIYVIDRDRVTCAGGVAPLDLMYALMRERHGENFARQVSDWFLHTTVRPAQGAQRAGLVERIGTTSQTVLIVVQAMESNLSEPLTLYELALVAGKSTRQLTRCFSQHLGQTPMQYYRALRLEYAKNLVTSSPLSMTDIALSSGFSHSAHFTSVFKEVYGYCPSEFRSNVATSKV